MCGHRVLRLYDFFVPSFNRARPPMGCLDFLVFDGFFAGDELEHALVYLQDGEPVPCDMRVVEIVVTLKYAAL
jgi:hypothetical protein